MSEHAVRDYAETPLAVDLSEVRNVSDLLIQRAAAAPNHVAFDVRLPGARIDEPWQPVTTRDFAGQVSTLTKGLIASGVEVGDRIVIMASTQYLWAVVDQAALAAGAIVVPVYDTASDSQLHNILSDATPVAAFVENEVVAERVSLAWNEIRSHADTSAQHDLACWPLHTDALPGLDDLAALGQDVSDEDAEARRLMPTLDDIATIVYTSGTTGDPKGALISHRNLVGQVLSIASEYKEVLPEDGNTILFLPLTHVLGRALQLICIANGMRVAHLATPKEVVPALSVLKPTFLVVVPRVLEKIEDAAHASAKEKKLEPVWLSAAKTAREWGAMLEARDLDSSVHPSLGLKIKHGLFEKLFYRRIRAVMGGRMRYLLSGAATLRPDTAIFFRGVGVPVIQGYGLTETTAPLTGGRIGKMVSGSVGLPMPGNAVRISESGEVLARGIGVFQGYRKPSHNDAAFADGYFRTGDLGHLDEAGNLFLTGRRGSVIVTSTGRTISPESWEQVAELHPLVAHAVMVGTDRPYVTALLVVDPQAARTWFESRAEVLPTAFGGRGWQQVEHEDLRESLSDAIEEANELMPPFQRVSRFAVVVGDEATLEGVMTATLKLKRPLFLEQTAALAAKLYS